MDKISQVFETEATKKEQLEEKKLRRSYFPNLLSIFLWFWILLASIWVTLYSWYYLWEVKRDYDSEFWKLRDHKTEEVESEVKRIITTIWSSSNLVYNLSMFHISPRVIIEEVEKAIYLWPDKVYTNENMTFSNYNTVTVGLITQDLENFWTLIKKLKKLYSDSFELKWLQNFWVTYETDDTWAKTGKVFYTTDATFKYLKDPGTNLVLKWVFDNNSEETQETKSVYENNKEWYTLFSSLLKDLADKRKTEGKKELYVSSTTTDNSIYLGTDIEYLGRNIYYVTKDNTLSDLFDLNGIWTKDDYNTLRTSNIKLLLITSQTGQDYLLCTKVLKDESELSTLEKEDTTWTLHTKVISEWNLEGTIKSLCELL